MVDWSLARQIARFAAGGAKEADLGAELREIVARGAEHVERYTSLSAAEQLPRPEVIDRAAWAEINLTSLADLLDPVAGRLGDRLDRAGPLAGPLRTAAGVALAAEAGLVVGYMSQRVLGQYELSLLQPLQPPRLLFVAPNLERAIRDMEVDRTSFLGWIALHELTHAFQFSGVTWLRGHLSELIRGYLKTVEVRVERSAGGLPRLPDPARIIAAFREGGLVALVQTPEQRDLLDEIQAAMAVIEGHSEHVMDALGSELLPAYHGLRDAMERRRRNRSAPERVLMRLLGLDLKLRQYELGKAFCDAVAGRGGADALSELWSAPEALPTLAELDDPHAWMGRVSGSGRPSRAFA